MSRWNLYDPDFYDEIVPFGSEGDDDKENDEGSLICTCYGRGKKLSEVDVPRVPQLQFQIEKQKYLEKLRSSDDPNSRKVGRGRARIRQKLGNTEIPSVGQSQGLEEQNKARSSDELLISCNGKDKDLRQLENNEKCNKEKTKKSHKRPKNIMNCVVSYDSDGNPIISTDDRGGVGVNTTKNGDIEDTLSEVMEQNKNVMEDLVSKKENQVEMHLDIPVKDSSSEEIPTKDENHKEKPLADKPDQKFKEEQKTNTRPSSKQNHSYEKPPRFIKKEMEELQAKQKMEITTSQSSNKPWEDSEDHSFLRSPQKTPEKEDSTQPLSPSPVTSVNSSMPTVTVVSTNPLCHSDTIVPPYIPLSLPYCPDYSSTYWLQYQMSHGVPDSSTTTSISDKSPSTYTTTTISCAPSMQSYQTYQTLSNTVSSTPHVSNPPSSVSGPKDSTFYPIVPPPFSPIGPPPSSTTTPLFSPSGPPPISTSTPPLRYPISVPPFPQYLPTLPQYAHPSLHTNMAPQFYNNTYFLPVAYRPLFHPSTRYPCQNQPVSMVGYLINSNVRAGIGNTFRTPPPFCTAISPDTMRTETFTSGNNNTPPSGNGDL
ncbi:uncharacterized protein LOC133176154 isoform X1 [Saccostrea echinata]|uniref:uncharacterized protein LOC133176154 isoform X1 n=1 Tax=Saccostrea echinata TaxID=191078 RepID=UPI002A83FEFC|nr:uncharacterized protein LOC133176154 isoform X1 [Saccostrea echinata]